MTGTKVTMTIPDSLYNRTQKLIEDGLFPGFEEIVEYGLRRALADSAAIQGSKIIALQDLRQPDLRLTAPLYVTAEPGETIVVSNSDLDTFGYGETEDEAIADFCQCVAETYWELKEEQDNLGPHLARIWAYLSRIVIEE